jgi:hypothetical protein
LQLLEDGRLLVVARDQASFARLIGGALFHQAPIEPEAPTAEQAAETFPVQAPANLSAPNSPLPLFEDEPFA